MSPTRFTAIACAVLGCATLTDAQTPPAPAYTADYRQPQIPENAVQRVSAHVYAIMAFPNIAIVVGDKATLVVDTGTGPKNGAIVAREAEKLAKGPGRYLTTTHFHPEHASGEQGFPANTKIVRCRVQQEELDQKGAEGLARFREAPFYRDFLPDTIAFRKPDILFDRETTIDLGGVHAKLMCYGAAHTKGDLVTLVEEDRTMITGDVVQNKVTPGITGDGSSPRTWIAVLDQLAPLSPRIIIPDHSPIGDGSLIAEDRNFLADVQSRALALKREGKSAAEAGQIVTTELQAKYASWNIRNLAGLVQRVYDDKP